MGPYYHRHRIRHSHSPQKNCTHMCMLQILLILIKSFKTQILIEQCVFDIRKISGNPALKDGTGFAIIMYGCQKNCNFSGSRPICKTDFCIKGIRYPMMK